MHPSWRIAALVLAFALVGAIAGVALERYSTIHIPRWGKEQSLVFNLDVPYGSVNLLGGSSPNDVATVETLAEDADTHNFQWSYSLRNKTVGVLHIGIGTDEGMNGVPPIAMNYANSGFSLASSPLPQSDMGSTRNEGFFYGQLPPIPGTYGFVVCIPGRSVSTDAGNLVETPFPAGTEIFLNRTLPIDLSANLGFGQSKLDLSGLPLMSAAIETGASQAFIFCNSENPEPLRTCSIRAGMGPCTFLGISNLNAYHFTFHGAVGSYHLGFEGKLLHNLDASVELGVGFCTISIPPTACRVQIFYDEGFLSSYSFSGLARQHDGYATSPGFNYSNSPILTLHLSSTAGRISVEYH